MVDGHRPNDHCTIIISCASCRRAVGENVGKRVTTNQVSAMAVLIHGLVSDGIG